MFDMNKVNIYIPALVSKLIILISSFHLVNWGLIVIRNIESSIRSISSCSTSDLNRWVDFKSSSRKFFIIKIKFT